MDLRAAKRLWLLVIDVTGAAVMGFVDGEAVVEFDGDRVKNLLNVTDNRLDVVALIPVGKTVGDGSQGIKRSLVDLSHHNTLGTQYNYD